MWSVVRLHDSRRSFIQRLSEHGVYMSHVEMHLRLVCRVVAARLVQRHDRVSDADPCMSHTTIVGAVLLQNVSLERTSHEIDDAIGIGHSEVRSDRVVALGDAPSCHAANRRWTTRFFAQRCPRAVSPHAQWHYPGFRWSPVSGSPIAHRAWGRIAVGGGEGTERLPLPSLVTRSR